MACDESSVMLWNFDRRSCQVISRLLTQVAFRQKFEIMWLLWGVSTNNVKIFNA